MPHLLERPTRKRRSPRSRARGFVTVCLIVGIGLAILAIVGVPTPLASKTQSAAFSSEPDAVLSSEFAAALPPREVYKYSVIKGGAYTAAELSHAVDRDPVVADHYRSVDIANLRAETVNAERLAYMSYRRGDQIYWTKHKVRLRQGETILTDGVNQVRSRCGNCISLEPMQPIAEDEPETVEFDALTSDPAVVATLPSSPYFLMPPPGLLLPPPFGTVPFDSIGPIPIGLIATNLSDLGPDAVSDPGVVEESQDLGGAVFAPDAPGAELPFPPAIPPDRFPGPDNPPNPGDPPPLVITPPLFDPPVDLPPDFDPKSGTTEDPVTPVPVPEPGTLLLIASGAIGLLRRQRARRSR